MAKDASETNSLLISLHIYKCGGSTLFRLIDRNFPQSQQFLTFSALESAPLKAKELLAHYHADQLQLIHGHIPFGWHEYFPERSCQYMTFLREPVDRLVSDYYYCLNNPHAHYHEAARQAASLRDYVGNSGIKALDNVLIRWVTGDLATPFGQMASSHLQKAKYNLERFFPFFGLTEFYDHSLVLLGATLGWKKLYYKPANVTQNKTAATEEDIQWLRESQHLDLAFYRFAEELFWERWRRLSWAGLRLGQLHLLNRLYALVK